MLLGVGAMNSTCYRRGRPGVTLGGPDGPNTAHAPRLPAAMPDSAQRQPMLVGVGWPPARPDGDWINALL